jgi:hypothetical protein
MTHRRAAKTLRKAAIRMTEGTAVVWSTKTSTLKHTEVLIYTGAEKLTRMTDEDIATQHTWLEREQYDTSTRDAIDELWTAVEKKRHVVRHLLSSFNCLSATNIGRA